MRRSEKMLMMAAALLAVIVLSATASAYGRDILYHMQVDGIGHRSWFLSHGNGHHDGSFPGFGTMTSVELQSSSYAYSEVVWSSGVFSDPLVENTCPGAGQCAMSGHGKHITSPTEDSQ